MDINNKRGNAMKNRRKNRTIYDGNGLWLAKIITIAALALVFILGSSDKANSGELTAELRQMSRTADDDHYQVGQWVGVKVEYTTPDGLSAFLSHETAQVIPLWGIGDMRLTGLGVGFKTKIRDGLRLYGNVGYYFISHENEGRHPSTGPAGEGMGYYFNDQYGFTTQEGYLHFDEYQIEYENAVGVELGVEYTKQLSESWVAGFTLGYRTLKVPELLRVFRDEWNFEETGACWEQNISRNYSSTNVGLSLTYNF